MSDVVGTCFVTEDQFLPSFCPNGTFQQWSLTPPSALRAGWTNERVALVSLSLTYWGWPACTILLVWEDVWLRRNLPSVLRVSHVFLLPRDNFMSRSDPCNSCEQLPCMLERSEKGECRAQEVKTTWDFDGLWGMLSQPSWKCACPLEVLLYKS